MRFSRLARTLVPAAVLGLVVALPAGAQQPMDQEAQAIMAELQQIQQHLAQIEVQALESDEALQERQEAVQDLVIGTMLELHPELESKFERMEQLQAEFAQAREAEDMERMQAVMSEAEGLQHDLMEAQADAMERPEVVQAIEDFRTQLVAKMHEIEPETEQLMARAEELARKLQDQT
jgi:predicted nuclease with TOPRIM domain